MYLGKHDLNSYEKGIENEYLISNRSWEFSSGSILGANTRKEHGLLVSSKNKCGDGFIYISKTDEIVAVGSKKYNLSTNKYRDSVYPDGYRYLQEFYANPFPVFTYVLHSAIIKKTLFMTPKLRGVVCKYEIISSPSDISFFIRPLMAHRSIKTTQTSENFKNFKCEATDKESVVVIGNEEKTYLNIKNSSWANSPMIYDNIVYEKAEKDGMAFLDCFWSPGVFEVNAKEGDVFFFVASMDPLVIAFEGIKQLENKSKIYINEHCPAINKKPLNEMTKGLFLSALNLVLSDLDKDLPSVLTGYPSLRETAFSTFVALPGLLLSTERYDVADKLLDKWITLTRDNDGVVPANVEPGFSDVPSGDSGLWMIYALGKYIDRIGSFDKVKLHWQDLCHIMSHFFEKCDKIGLYQDSSGLIALTDNGLRSDWMSERHEGGFIVNRDGFFVETNALFFNALKVMEYFSLELKDKSAYEEYKDNANLVLNSYRKYFWNDHKNCLFDWVTSSERGDEIRPNQILAVSLPYTPLEPEKGRAVVKTCWDFLYTTFGLRTLDPKDEKFKGRFEGHADQRQKARFRGMAWPWLLTHFITAFMRYYPQKSDIALMFTRPFASHLVHGCLGGVAEVFDGAMPYDPHGDFLSALSVGEILRVLDEDLLEFDRL